MAQQGWGFEPLADVLASLFTRKTEPARQERPQTPATSYTGLPQIPPSAASGNSSSAHLPSVSGSPSNHPRPPSLPRSRGASQRRLCTVGLPLSPPPCSWELHPPGSPPLPWLFQLILHWPLRFGSAPCTDRLWSLSWTCVLLSVLPLVTDPSWAVSRAFSPLNA